MSEYAEREAQDLEPYYIRHVAAMTAEGLHSKAAIAKELAYRDKRIADLERQLAAMSPLIEACKARYERHNQEHYKISGVAPCRCLTCQWYRDYKARKPK